MGNLARLARREILQDLLALRRLLGKRPLWALGGRSLFWPRKLLSCTFPWLFFAKFHFSGSLNHFHPINEREYIFGPVRNSPSLTEAAEGVRVSTCQPHSRATRSVGGALGGGQRYALAARERGRAPLTSADRIDPSFLIESTGVFLSQIILIPYSQV